MMAPKANTPEGAADARTPFQKFDDLAHQLFPAVKASGKRPKASKPKRKKARH
jgi:hypothetical protein